MSRKMICHYEVLELDQNADDDTIKRNYRKLALKYHPDKNLENENEAKLKFQSIQAAYEILSDSQERAWYDKHRDQILKGGKSNYEDDSLDVYAYFTSTCYKGFGDDSEGFYSVYRTVFEKLAAEDVEYIDENEFEAIPKFGNSKSDLDDVVNFYGYWESYSTKKSFAWLFTHDISEIRDRRVLKIIDKEHKKIQQKARKERNEEIRSLVLFAKKRDKRMVEYRRMLEEKAEQNRIKSQQNRLEQIKKRSEEIKEQQKNSKIHKDHEDQLRRLEKEYLNQYSDSEEEEDYDDDEEDTENVEDIENGIDECEINSNNEEDEEIYDDELYCVACNKFFNSVKAKTNHDSSKKHKQNMELLKSQMNLDEENYQKSTNETNGNEEEHEEEEEKEEAVTLSKGKKSKKKKGRKNINYEQAEKSDDETNVNDEVADSSSVLKVNESEDEDWVSNKKGKKTKAKGKPKPEKMKETKIIEEKVVETPIKDKEEICDPQEINRCASCKQNFPSKNKLFNHLKTTNHSVHLGEVNKKNCEKPTSKKRK